MLVEFILRRDVLPIIYTLIFSFAGYLIIKYLVLHAFSRLVGSALISESEKQLRISTVQSFTLTIVKIVFILIVLFSFLQIFGVDIKGLLLSAGIIGLAISFGSQSLIKDLVSGLFILTEGQFNIGDPVEIDGVSGVVAAITLRYVQIVDTDGNLSFLPFGQISKVKNIRPTVSLSDEHIPEVAFENAEILEQVILINKKYLKSLRSSSFFVHAAFFDTEKPSFSIVLQGLKAETKSTKLAKELKSSGYWVVVTKAKHETCVLTIPLKKVKTSPEVT